MSEVKGIIFDIQRFSLQDGPGIRTTVFLKGCPLRCIWCHNPESWSFEVLTSYNANLCRNCMACVSVCGQGAHRNICGRHEMDHNLCSLCGKCSPVCNYSALRQVGETMAAGEVVDTVLKDRDFYQCSGGGATLSGGEPMAQYEFSLKLLKRLKDAGIHTCLETCGFASREKYAGVLPYVDIFLYDFKETDSGRHKELTGVPNDMILSNLDFLYSKGASIVLRCPLVPGINDSDNHFKEIAALSEKYPGLMGIELMAYHDLGVEKGCRVGEKSVLTGFKTTDGGIKAQWLVNLQASGCNKAILG